MRPAAISEFVACRWVRLLAAHLVHTHHAVLEPARDDYCRPLTGLIEQIPHDRLGDVNKLVFLPQDPVVTDEGGPQRIAGADNRIEKAEANEFAHMPIDRAGRHFQRRAHLVHGPDGPVVFEQLKEGKQSVGARHGVFGVMAAQMGGNW